MKKKVEFWDIKKCFSPTNVTQMTFIMSFILLFIKIYTRKYVPIHLLRIDVRLQIAGNPL